MTEKKCLPILIPMDTKWDNSPSGSSASRRMVCQRLTSDHAQSKFGFATGRVITEIPSDSKDYIGIDPCEGEACFKRNITYAASLPQMGALTDISEGCHQEFKVAILM